ncbi:unnamed protein product [Soboliphyme baturini]|uniref:deoxyribose-phosphate aldolase n=1 Tax=Soboliphyme baturini TaxID=241478 RepID=A0A183ISM7_9BILA|nr:unnamed protein product [Soboliphyme baturini]
MALGTRNVTAPFSYDKIVCPQFSASDIANFCQPLHDKAAKLDEQDKKNRLLRLVQLIDLTSLGGDDTPAKIRDLVDKAVNPLPADVAAKLETKDVHCAAVCLYPARVCDAVSYIKEKYADHVGHLHISSVAGGFPSGQYKLVTRLQEATLAIADGADELDVVINRAAALQGDWETVYNELSQMRAVCSETVHLKTILATGELKNVENIYKASMSAMLAGADFIKTSTGKEVINATLQSAWVMCSAIKDFHKSTGIQVGFKPAGGIRSVDEALSYMLLVEELLGKEWICPELFRIGASSLLNNVVKLLA